jgi:hypothetical protein
MLWKMLEEGGHGGQLRQDEEETEGLVRDPAVGSTPALNAFYSKLSSAKDERHMYKPFSEALNYALEMLSEINVDGLPEFEEHIVFVPLDEGVESDRDLEGSLFKPDIIIMSFDAACRFRNVRDTRTLTVSQFISKIPPKASTKKGSKANSSSRVGWKDVLSAVEMKRDPKDGWPLLGHFSENVPQIVSEGMDAQLLQSRNTDPATPSDVSQSQTRKIHTLAYEHPAEVLHSCDLKISRE